MPRGEAFALRKWMDQILFTPPGHKKKATKHFLILDMWTQGQMKLPPPSPFLFGSIQSVHQPMAMQRVFMRATSA